MTTPYPPSSGQQAPLPDAQPLPQPPVPQAPLPQAQPLPQAPPLPRYPTGTPGSGQYPQPPTPQQMYAYRGAAQPPVAQPGIVPLRPLGLGDILRGAWEAVRHNPGAMLGLPALVIAIATLVGALIGQIVAGPLGRWLADELSRLTGSVQGLNAMVWHPGDLGQMMGSSVGLGLTMLLAMPIVYGILTVSVSRSVIGDRPAAGEVWARVRPRIGLLIGWSLLQTLLLVAISVVGALALAGIIIAVAHASEGVAALLGFLLAIAFAALLVWLSVRMLLITPAIALERGGLGASFRRGWHLSKGSFWRLLGIYLLASILVGLAASLVTLPFSIGTGLISATTGSTALSVILTTISSFISTAITTVFLAGVVALLYIDLRMRNEQLANSLAIAAGVPLHPVARGWQQSA